MISPNSPSDPTTRCVGSASASASAGASNNPPGTRRVRCVGPVPTLTGTDAQSEPPAAPPTTASETPDAPTHNKPGTTWLITDRTRPFWTATRDLLADTRWHHRDELYDLGQTHGLAERTIANLLPRASKRGWIARSRGHVRIRDVEAFTAALTMDGVER